MKNIHILPTDKPSRLCINGKNGQHIYITSDEEIKDGDYYLYLKDNSVRQFIYKHHLKLLRLDIQKKIILTTDQDLIKDGVQVIDDEFLEWFVKNPTCEEIEVIPLRKSSGYYDEKEIWHWDFLAYKIIIPKEETLEEAVELYFRKKQPKNKTLYKAAKFGAKWQAERMYSEEEIIKILIEYDYSKINDDKLNSVGIVKKWFTQFKK